MSQDSIQKKIEGQLDSIHATLDNLRIMSYKASDHTVCDSASILETVQDCSILLAALTHHMGLGSDGSTDLWKKGFYDMSIVI